MLQKSFLFIRDNPDDLKISKLQFDKQSYINSESVMSYFLGDRRLDSLLWKFADITFRLAGHRFLKSIHHQRLYNWQLNNLFHLLYWAPSGQGHLPF